MNEAKEKKETTDAAPQQPAPFDFMTATGIDVELTYLQFTPILSVKFPGCKMILTNEEKTAKSKFFALPVEQQAAGRHAFNVDYLCYVVEKKPEGLGAGFDELWNDADVAELNEANRAKYCVRSFLEKPVPMAVRIAEDATNLYSQYAQPLEFFR